MLLLVVAIKSALLFFRVWCFSLPVAAAAAAAAVLLLQLLRLLFFVSQMKLAVC